MQNLRSLRQRIRSVQNTQKITKAMQMVAGAKLRRSLEELVSFRPYAEALGQVTQRFLSAHPGLDHPLLEKNSALEEEEMAPGEEVLPLPPAGLVIITSDTGLCGTYNEKVLSVADRFRMEFPSAVVVAIGRKGTRSLAHRGGPRPAKEIVTWGGRFQTIEVGQLLNWLETEFIEGRVSSWNVATTRFISALSWKPVVERLLPVERPAAQRYPEKIIVEPDAATFADRLLRRQLRSQFARVLREVFTAEHSARMVAMKNATENADEMISSLTRVRNKARQATITKELIEVVSGAEALK